jgi:biopolymer transport protein ExbD
MATAATGSEGRPYADINMTPLIDVMLVLLIIFIITIPTLTHGIEIDNPSPSKDLPPATPPAVELHIDFDGTLTWNAVAVDRATLRRYVEAEAARSPQPEVHIGVDRFARYEVVAQALADLQHRGLRKIGFVNGDHY